MSTPAIAYLAREYVQNRLLDTSTGFNALIDLTAVTYSVQAFQLSVSSQPPSLYTGRYDAPTIQTAMGNASSLNYPLAILSVSKLDAIGKQAMRVTPSTFSGQVIVSVDFYVTYPFGSIPPDGEAMFFAVTDALAGAMDARGSFNAVPPGLIYNNEISAEQGVLTWDTSRWLQFIPCGIAFHVVA